MIPAHLNFSGGGKVGRHVALYAMCVGWFSES